MAVCDSLKVVLCLIFRNLVVAADVETIDYELFAEGFLLLSAIGRLKQLLF